jgi:hypothetical protein
MSYMKEMQIEAMECELDSCYRDIDYYESIHDQKTVIQVERRIALVKKQLKQIRAA